MTRNVISVRKCFVLIYFTADAVLNEQAEDDNNATAEEVNENELDAAMIGIILKCYKIKFLE